jgi:hypothetical protein
MEFGDTPSLRHLVPHGGVVCISAAQAGPALYLTASPPGLHLQSSPEAFRLRYHGPVCPDAPPGACTISLQRLQSPYESLTPGSGGSWTLHPGCGREQLLTAVADAGGDFTLSPHGEAGTFLAVGESQDVTQRKAGPSEAVARWRARLVRVPCINVRPLLDHMNIVCSSASPGELSRQARDVVRLLGHVHRSVGVFYVIGHGVAPDAFQLLTQRIGPQPMRGDPSPDLPFKVQAKVLTTIRGVPGLISWVASRWW